MIRQFLAQYLLNKKLLNKEQIIEILDNTNKNSVAPSTIAVYEGLMTAQQVEEVQHQQIESGKTFGEIAVERGFLSAEQIEKIDHAVRTAALHFMQAIIDNGFIGFQELQHAIKEYHDANELAKDAEETPIPFKRENAKLYGQYINAFMNALRRFVGVKPKILSPRPLVASGKWLIAQSLIGQESLGTAMLLDKETLYALAKAYSKEPVEDDEVAVDCVAEFLNVLNGLFMVLLSNEHIDVDLESHSVKKNMLPQGSEQMNVEIGTALGRFTLILATDSLL